MNLSVFASSGKIFLNPYGGSHPSHGAANLLNARKEKSQLFRLLLKIKDITISK